MLAGSRHAGPWSPGGDDDCRPRSQAGGLDLAPWWAGLAPDPRAEIQPEERCAGCLLTDHLIIHHPIQDPSPSIRLFQVTSLPRA